MALATWRRRLVSKIQALWTRNAQTTRCGRRRLELDLLEDRVVLATFTVSSTTDPATGANPDGSLRRAITQLNLSTDADNTINFDIADAASVITLRSGLPSISKKVTIDGTAPQGKPNQTITIAAGGTFPANTDGLKINAAATGSQVKKLIISGMKGNGILVEANDCKILGTQIMNSVASGIRVNGKNAVIGGMNDGERNSITGNAVGVWLAGAKGVPNTNKIHNSGIGGNQTGISISSGGGNLIGASVNQMGELVTLPNSITGSVNDGIRINASPDNVIAGNYIGIVKTQNGFGLVARNSRNGNGIVIRDPLSTNNLIGGDKAALRNYISGSILNGILITGAGANNKIYGNFIGTNTNASDRFDDEGHSTSNGSGAVESKAGVYVIDTPQTVIGDSGDKKNVIAGNLNLEIYVTGATSTQTKIIGNIISASADGETPLVGGEVAAIEFSGGGNSTCEDNVGFFPRGAKQGVKIANSPGTVDKSKLKVVPPPEPPDDMTARSYHIQNSEDNLLSGVLADSGITITASTNIAIEGSFIGVDESDDPTGNPLAGIIVDDSSSTVTIGGGDEGQGNIIAHNGGAGILITGDNVAITGNDFHDNDVDILVAGGSDVTLDDNTLESLVISHGDATLVGPSSIASITLGTFNGAATLYAEGGFTQSASDQLTLFLGGDTSPVAGTDYAHLVVTGSGDTVSLDGTLNLLLLSTLTASDNTVFTIIDNQTSNPVSGTFDGLPEEEEIIINGWTFSISYVGGDGNDVELTVIDRPVDFGPLIIENANNVTITGQDLPYGVIIINSTNITLQGNNIGTDEYGAATGNVGNGIYVDADSSNIVIGGSGSGEGNLIAHNAGVGIYIAGSNVSIVGNDLYDNFGGGILIEGGSAVTISGNSVTDGLALTNAEDVTIQGNTFSVEYNGYALLNPFDGIYVDDGSSTITIGGSGEDEGNIITNNGGVGINIAGSIVTVVANEISGNTNGGILIDGGSAVTLADNVIGDNVTLIDATNVTIQGNYIGVNQEGEALDNGADGIYIDDGSSTITIGGSGSGEGNTIAYNGGSGIVVAGSDVTIVGNDIYGNGGDGIAVVGTTDITIQGNTIGLDPEDEADGNFGAGISIDEGSSTITLGGSGSGEGNTIAENGGAGIYLAGNDVTIIENDLYDNAGGGVLLEGASAIDILDNNLFDGLVMIDATDITVQGNAINGISLDAGSSTITLGGSGSGEGNDISGNGIYLAGSFVTVLGNTLDVIGSDGLFITEEANDITVGGTASGAGNQINSVTGNGVSIAGTNVTLLGNTIEGTAEDGQAGLYVAAAASAVTIGGLTSGAGNLIALNYSNGIHIDGTSGVTIAGNTIYGNTLTGILLTGASTITIQGNVIGLDPEEQSSGNSGGGISIDADSSSITIGGTGSGEGNTIAANPDFGISIAGSQVVVLGNTITVNGPDGILITETGNNVTIGGSATGAGNTITNQSYYGIEILGDNVSVVNNTITGNYYGILVNGGTGVSLSGNTLDSLTILGGDATISGTSTIDNVIISGGTLTVAASLTVSETFDQNAGAMHVNSGVTVHLAGTIDFDGGLLALNGGTLDADSTLTIGTGATLAGAGTLIGDVENSGTITLGAPHTRGALAITGNFAQTSSGVFNVTLDSQSLTYDDRLAINGSATLDGTFNAYLASGYTPTVNDVFAVLESNGITGTFGSINLPSYSGGSLVSGFDDPLDPHDFLLTAL